MSDRPSVPYLVQLSMAALSRNPELVQKVMNASIGSMTHEFLAIAQSYSRDDLPLVVASLKLTAQALMPILSETGKQVMNDVLENTTGVTITGEAFKND